MSTAVIASAPPAIRLAPAAVSSRAAELFDLCREAGLILDGWQEDVLTDALGVRDDGRWSALEVGLCVPRQNGKGSILEARELGGLFLFRERRITHSAHQFDTSLEHFGRLLELIEQTPYLDQQVARVVRSHGEEGIYLLSGERIRFRTRTKGGGRGFSGDLVVVDEAMIYPTASHGALMPTMSARPNPQTWLTGSAVDQELHEHGIVFARMRARALTGSARLAYTEWSFDPRAEDDGTPAHPEMVSADMADDPEAWAAANPAWGIRIGADFTEAERRSMDPRTFAVERLGVGDWPAVDTEADGKIPLADWRALADEASSAEDPVALAFDVTHDRKGASIGAAGLRPDGRLHLEVIDRRPGTGWVVDRLAELVERHEVSGVVCGASSPAASLVGDLADAGVQVEEVGSADFARACGSLVDGAGEKTIAHLGQPELETAVRAAATRPVVDAWVWSRKASRGDITPLVAVTLASWATANTSAPFVL